MDHDVKRDDLREDREEGHTYPEGHASTGGSAAAGAVTGGIIGAVGAGPVGAAVGAVGGAVIGAAGERAMHADNDAKLRDTGTAGTTTGMRRDATTESERTMQLREEELVAGKRMAEAGEVELKKNVVTEHRSVDVPVSHEEVVVERHPVDRRPADRPIGEGEEMEVPIREEHVTAEKRPYVAEEVTVGKRTVQDTERVEGEVRRETLDVDTEGDVRVDDRR